MAEIVSPTDVPFSVFFIRETHRKKCGVKNKSYCFVIMATQIGPTGVPASSVYKMARSTENQPYGLLALVEPGPGLRHDGRARATVIARRCTCRRAGGRSHARAVTRR